VVERSNAAASNVVSRHVGMGVLPAGTPAGEIPPSPQNQNKISSAFLKEVIERSNAAASKVVSRHVGTGGLPAGHQGLRLAEDSRLI